jgi:hypothetical protein
LATGSGSFCDAPEKKPAILSLNEGGPDGEAGGGVAGVAEVVAEGAPVAAGDSVPVPIVLLLQPATASASVSNAAISARLSRFVR